MNQMPNIFKPGINKKLNNNDRVYYSGLNENNLRKASYSKEEIKQILSMINDDYQKKKELEGKGKVLIKDNSMY